MLWPICKVLFALLDYNRNCEHFAMIHVAASGNDLFHILLSDLFGYSELKIEGVFEADVGEIVEYVDLLGSRIEVIERYVVRKRAIVTEVPVKEELTRRKS